MDERADFLLAAVVRAWIILFVIGVLTLVIQDFFMIWPLTSASAWLAYTLGRMDERFHQDHSVKIN